MDIETTPKSENSSSLGRRHTPTARMSERKRNLFEKKYNTLALIIDDDVDLGPMSPLQYSSSPTEDDQGAHGVPFDRNAKQTDFSNLFPGSLKASGASASPSIRSVPRASFSLNSPMFSTEKQLLIVEESASSSQAISVQGVPHQQPQQHHPIQSHPEEEMTTNAEESSQHSSKIRTVQEKTPSERMINCQELRVSFKKSLILGDIVTPSDEEQRMLKNHQKRSYSTSVLAEKNSSTSPGSTSPREKMQKLAARTSLTFEGVAIPTNRFYATSGRTNDENSEPAAAARKRYSLPVLPLRSEKRNSSSHRRSRDHGGVTKGCGHKIKKPVRGPVKEALKKKVELAVLDDLKEKEKEMEKLNINSAQTTRIHEILKNAKNPLEMSRPLFFTEKTGEDRFIVSDEEIGAEEEEEIEKSKRKFFKSGSKGAKSYKLTNNVVATVEGGKITLPKFPAQQQSSSGNSFSSHGQPPQQQQQEVNISEPAEFSMVEEEFGSEFEEVTGIISKLTNDDAMDGYRSRLPYGENVDSKEIERQTEILEMLIANGLCTEENFKIFIAEPEQHKEEMNRVMDSLVAGQSETQKLQEDTKQKEGLFPIFYQNQLNRQTKQRLVAMGGEKTSPSTRKVWKRIGDTQLQIDAGQRRFGATYCAECDLLYSVHEPEDELMHERFHAALSVLKFTGWKQETVVKEEPQWGIHGRIIAVPANEHKTKLLRVNGVLEVVNKEMGCPMVDWRSKTIVYLAVAQNTILGVCVAEARYEANRLVTESGVDFFSEEGYPVWCGISRIWVAAPYRNQGVATELVNAVRGHFTIGRTLGVEEIAFQSPTEAGKLLGQKVANRKDFLVYP